MNITILNWRDPEHPLAGGAEQSLFQHAKYWKRKGAKITWISSGFEKSKSNFDLEGIKFYRLGSHFTVHLLSAFYLRNIKDTDIYIDSFHFLPFFTPIYKNKMKVIALINEPAKNAWFKNIIFPVALAGFLFEPFFFKFYKEVPFITSATSIKRELKNLGISSGKINVIPHGVTIAKSKKKYVIEKNPTIIYLSQLSPDKGIEDAIKAVGIMQQHRDINFWIAGKAISKSYEAKIKKLIKSSKLSNVKYFGFISEEKKSELLQKSWLLIHPSSREGWGLNVIEANIFGTPAVGYNVTGLRDSIKNKSTGLLTSINTPADIAEKCLSIIEDKKLREILSKNAKNWARGFNWDASGEKSWNLVNKIYEKSKK